MVCRRSHPYYPLGSLVQSDFKHCIPGASIQALAEPTLTCQVAGILGQLSVRLFQYTQSTASACVAVSPSMAPLRFDPAARSEEVGFTHAEFATYDTSMTTIYSLQIMDSSYDLRADGALLYSGLLRDYSGVAFPDVYAINNYLFFGDNTTSAQGRVTLGNISLTTFVPLPPSIGLMLAACLGLALQGCRTRVH